MRITIDIHDGEISPEEVLIMLADSIAAGYKMASGHINGPGPDAPAKFVFDPPIPADFAKLTAQD